MIPQRQETVAVVDLEAFCIDAFTSVGVGEEYAKTTARVLTTTDSWGIHTHGVKSLPGYIRRLKAGGTSLGCEPEVLGEGPGWMIADGRSNLGMVTSVWCMEQAIAKAHTCGVAYVGARNSSHFGAAGYYANMAAEVGMIGLAMANDAPSMNIPGALGRILGNNPLAVAIPCGELVMMLDIAMSTVAGGKVMAAFAAQQKIPATWCVDLQGRPTTIPGDFPAGGALTPMAGHKGYGLALMVESLSAVLTGAHIASQVHSWILDSSAAPTGHGAAFIAIDISAMMPTQTFVQRMQHLATEMRSAPRIEGCDRILLPGEMEHERRIRSLREGITLPAEVIAGLRSLAVELNLDVSVLFH